MHRVPNNYFDYFCDVTLYFGYVFLFWVTTYDHNDITNAHIAKNYISHTCDVNRSYGVKTPS